MQEQGARGAAGAPPRSNPALCFLAEPSWGSAPCLDFPARRMGVQMRSLLAWLSGGLRDWAPCRSVVPHPHALGAAWRCRVSGPTPGLQGESASWHGPPRVGVHVLRHTVLVPTESWGQHSHAGVLCICCHCSWGHGITVPPNSRVPPAGSGGLGLVCLLLRAGPPPPPQLSAPRPLTAPAGSWGPASPETSWRPPGKGPWMVGGGVAELRGEGARGPPGEERVGPGVTHCPPVSCRPATLLQRPGPAPRQQGGAVLWRGVPRHDALALQTHPRAGEHGTCGLGARALAHAHLGPLFMPGPEDGTGHST